MVMPESVSCFECDGTATPVRWHDEGTEYQCAACGSRHTRKEGDENAYAFFPGDIHAMLDSNLKPFPFGRKRRAWLGWFILAVLGAMGVAFWLWLKGV